MPAERDRIEATKKGSADWRSWGPYVSDRQWGTVREDYSTDGSAWDYLPHDEARSRAYRWGEDGIGGLCDENQYLVIGLALHNGVDPILKEPSSVSPTGRATTARTSRNCGGTRTRRPPGVGRMLYKYPQRSSLSGTGRGERTPDATGPGVRAHRHRILDGSILGRLHPRQAGRRIFSTGSRS